MRLAYDGTDFSGWQIQKNQRTVQGVVAQALEQIHGHPVDLRAAGRTDSGVHAHGQVANFISDSTIPTGRFGLALNTKLPRDVQALASDEVSDTFHSRYDARWRVYKYFIHNAPYDDPFSRRYSIIIKRKLDINLLNVHAAALIGIHDFTTFSAAGDQSESKIREIRNAVFYPEREFLVFRIVGNAFLWRMVRSILGTLLEIEESRRASGYLKSVLCARDRSLAGTTAQAKGLSLYQVGYDE